MAGPQTFFSVTALPYANQVHAALPSIYRSVVLAQWFMECWDPAIQGPGPDWTLYHDPGNVGDPAAGGQTQFVSLYEGTLAEIATLKLGYYTAVLAATNRTAQAVALGESPWAASHYGNPPGSDLLQVMATYDLAQFDGITPPPPPPPEPQEDDVLVALTSTEKGYWVVTSNGAVFAYGDAVYKGGINDAGPGGTTALVPGDYPTGIAGAGTTGYLISTAHNNLYAFGTAPFFGHP